MFNTAACTAYGDVTVLNSFMGKMKRSSSAPAAADQMTVSAVYRWNSHPVLISFWQQVISDKLADHDSILFVAPHLRGYGAREYKREVWSTCERLMERLGNTHSWRVAWYSGWDQWPVTTTECITWQMCLFRRDKKERTLVVPISTVLPNFDTDTVLPNVLVTKGVDFVSPPQFSTTLVTGFAELIKNHLLGGASDCQLSNRCAACLNPRCDYSKGLLVESAKTLVPQKL